MVWPSKRATVMTPADAPGWAGRWPSAASGLEIEKTEAGAANGHAPDGAETVRSGMAPLNVFTKHNITVAVGIDEAGINDDRDMLQEMRLILNVHRVPGMDDAPPSCAQVLRMATEHGAATTPFGDRIGRLEPGRFADYVVINHRRALYPYQDSLIGIVDAILQRAKPAAVDATIINGVTVYEDGKFKLVNREQILGEIASLLAQPRNTAEQESIAISQDMQVFVRSFYEDYYDDSAHAPFYKQSSHK